ncbi:XrtX-associated membrane protein [Hymenobacter sp. B1770]|uniref:XrtX-associated membrane protein n=1 Tax=Hymenobacter sp. B1770 TaxID=1718788 RepID=UPI003CF6168C
MPSVLKQPSQITPKSGLVRYGQWAIAGFLVGVLFLIGVFDEPVLQALTKFWQSLMASLGLSRTAQTLQQGIDGGITTRFLPAVATYAVLYLGTCLLLLRILLPPASWLLVLRLYAGALAIYAAMVLLNKFTGNSAWAYRLSRQLLDFIVSPLPVAGLYVLMRAGFGPQTFRS